MKPDACFGNIIGHQFVKDLLIKLVDSHRLAPALLFGGPGLVGKKSMAISLAKYLNCELRSVASCACDSCRKITAANHPDLRFIAPDGFTRVIKVDDIRDMQDWAYITPIESHQKVVICNQADRMNLSSANSMLKILEEPPKHLLVILITTNPYAILPTIRSRCTPLNFNPLPEAAIKHWLMETWNMAEDLAEILALLSEGAPGRAVEIMEANYKLALMPGTSKSDVFTAWQSEIASELKLLRQGGFAAIFRVAQNLVKSSGSTEKSLDFLLTWYRDLLINSLTKDSRYFINKNLKGLINREAEHYHRQGIYQIIDTLLWARQLARRTIIPRLLLEVTLTKMGKLLRQYELRDKANEIKAT